MSGTEYLVSYVNTLWSNILRVRPISGGSEVTLKHFSLTMDRLRF